MKKLKDFLYDKSDLLIALAILLIAAVLIAWRLDVIMDYPKEIVKDNDHQTEFPLIPPEEDESDDTGEGPSEGSNDSEEGSNEESSENTEESDDEESVEEPETPLWESGVLTREVTVTVRGNSATAAVQCLIDAGLFESYDEYVNLCAIQGVAHPESVVGGTFTFDAGTDKQTILSYVNWS